jgi:hypothetical protein
MQPITIEVAYQGQFPVELVEYLKANYDVTIERNSPLVIRTGDFSVLAALTRLIGQTGAQVSSIRYRRASSFALAAMVA